VFLLRNSPEVDKYDIRNTQDEKMAGRIIINTERCKGCGLCVAVCPKSGIVLAKKSNKSGYFPAQPSNADCTGCAVCAIICPDATIEVQQDDPGKGKVVTKPGRKTKPRLVGGKR
jgi:2-oxoglutarate ferredoxin oxidoreductase subunit delta